MYRCQGRRGPVSLRSRFRDAKSFHMLDVSKHSTEKASPVNEDLQRTSAWDDYRSRRRWFFFILLSGTPVVVLTSILLNKVFHSSGPFYIIGLAWMIFFVTVSIRLVLFRCPRCRRFFFFTGYSSNHFARRCVHCGLPKWSEADIKE